MTSLLDIAHQLADIYDKQENLYNIHEHEKKILTELLDSLKRGSAINSSIMRSTYDLYIALYQEHNKLNPQNIFHFCYSGEHDSYCRCIGK